MRIQLRFKIALYTFFMMLSKTQRLEGITSKLKNGKHIILIDIENCDAEICIEELANVQDKYKLSNIYITSDTYLSFRAWCFTQTDFKTLLKIILDIPHI